MTYSRICCPKCSKDFGQESRFFEHMSSVHGIEDYLTLYVELYHDGSCPTCQCSPECSEKLTWVGWKKGFQSKYVRGHNARVDSVYLDPRLQKEMADKRSSGYANGKYVPWNKGLTKETSDKMSDVSNLISSTLRERYATGRITDWRKKNPEKALDAASRMSSTKKKMFASGELKQWNEGLTKENNSSIASAAEKISENYKISSVGRRIKIDELEDRLKNFSDKFQLISPLSDYRRRRVDRLHFRCVKCGFEQLKSLAMLEESPICFSCSPKESKGQLELYEFIKSISSDAVLSDRKLIAPREVDVLVPSAKLAIEYNGLYWHSVANIPDKNYHESKRRSVESAGHRFFMIFEDEWRDKRPIIESMIRHRLGCAGEVSDARKLKVEDIDSKSAESFFQSSHLEGHVRSESCLGLVDGSGRIIAAMSLRKPFHSSRSQSSLEVARSACLPGTTVRGWVGKLSSASMKRAKCEGIDSLISYVDARVGLGKSYLSGGWSLESCPKGPRFWWTDFNNRFNRFKFRANRLAGETQSEVASREGVVMIWGCGNYVMNYCSQ